MLLLLGCGQSGTLQVSLVFPDGQTRLPTAATKVRLTVEISGAPRTTEAPVAADGSFSLDASFDAMDASATVRLDALDAGGAVVARGLTPAVPLAAYSQRITLFMGPPGRFATSPARLPGPRAELAIAPLAYGVVLAGGRDAAGDRAGDVVIYSAVSQAIAIGMSLPSPRARLAAFGASFNVVYFFGGDGDGDQPTADLWQLDTNVAPSGSYAVLAAPATLARSGTAALTIGTDKFLLSGSPPALLDATTSTATLTAITGTPDGVGTATAGATTATAAGQVEVVVGGPNGIFLYDGAFKKIGDDAVTDAAAVTLPSTDVLLVGPQAHRVTAAGVVTDVTLTATARHNPAVAVARGTLVVAGGFDAGGAPLGDAELFDAATLAPMGSVPLPTPRGGALAYPLTSGQILLVSGRGPGGPLATIEIFTP